MQTDFMRRKSGRVSRKMQRLNAGGGVTAGREGRIHRLRLRRARHGPGTGAGQILHASEIAHAGALAHSHSLEREQGDLAHCHSLEREQGALAHSPSCERQLAGRHIHRPVHDLDLGTAEENQALGGVTGHARGPEIADVHLSSGRHGEGLLGMDAAMFTAPQGAEAPHSAGAHPGAKITSQ
jgi:hypothetical protein